MKPSTSELCGIKGESGPIRCTNRDIGISWIVRDVGRSRYSAITTRGWHRRTVEIFEIGPGEILVATRDHIGHAARRWQIIERDERGTC
jgi:hypothetical protein